MISVIPRHVILSEAPQDPKNESNFNIIVNFFKIPTEVNNFLFKFHFKQKRLRPSQPQRCSASQVGQGVKMPFTFFFCGKQKEFSFSVFSFLFSIDKEHDLNKECRRFWHMYSYPRNLADSGCIYWNESRSRAKVAMAPVTWLKVHFGDFGDTTKNKTTSL